MYRFSIFLLGLMAFSQVAVCMEEIVPKSSNVEQEVLIIEDIFRKIREAKSEINSSENASELKSICQSHFSFLENKIKEIPETSIENKQLLTRVFSFSFSLSTNLYQTLFKNFENKEKQDFFNSQQLSLKKAAIHMMFNHLLEYETAVKENLKKLSK